MAANVLKSRQAVQMSVFVVRAFIRLRENAIAYREIAAKVRELEQKTAQHDSEIQTIIEAIRRLMTPPPREQRKIGF